MQSAFQRNTFDLSSPGCSRDGVFPSTPPPFPASFKLFVREQPEWEQTWKQIIGLINLNIQ